MKFDTTKLMANTAVPHVTRRNQAWAIDIARFDLKNRVPFVMMVIEVHTRLPLSATVSPATHCAAATGLDRIVRRSGPPNEIWIDRSFEPMIRAWAEQHRIAVTYGQMLKVKSLAEPIFRDLGAFLRGNLFSNHAKLGLGVEKWRQSYAAAARSLPNVNQ
jgi:hypothetical protein